MNGTDPAAGRRRPRRLVALALTCTTVAVVGVTGTVVAAAERTPPTPVWSFAESRQEPGERPGELAELLVPYDDYDHSYGPGPDALGWDYDGEFSDSDLKKRFVETAGGSGLSREDLGRAFAHGGPRAMAVRSYAREHGGQGTVVTTVLMRMRSEQHARATARAVGEQLDARKDLRPGPTPEGRPGIRCYRVPSLPELPDRGPDRNRVEQLECLAPVGDVLMTADVYAAPVEQLHLALLGEQFDRLARRGEPA
ncbi:hypothetical protein ACSMX9_15880 [Streptomyces sp. LE64]|uniref:hypothetical protein n=1 Tax=Streptomyces sp. LE64 TaxID=3448653 RepID=UPI00404105DE